MKHFQKLITFKNELITITGVKLPTFDGQGLK